MRKQLPLLVLLLLPLLAWAQTVTVPKNVYFADVHLRISDAAQQEIQKKVDALHRNQTYFKIKVDLANAYFPVIERVFKEEGVPDDFKYLALQESGLIGDAVSTSNAVGYWQFKKEAASDFNLRMDNVVDERRHIIEASRGAAQYFKRSNKNYDNWFTSLLSYYLGYTGVKTYSKSSDVGSKKMDVTEKSHPYVITFLAHKIAYDNFIGRDKPAVSLRELRATPGQSLTDIALATKTDYAELEKYNKWLLGNSIPSDKDYYVMVPVRSGETGVMASAAKEETPVAKTTPVSKATPSAPQQNAAAATAVKRNGLSALIARPNDTKDKLALQAGISTRKFLKYNDLHNFDEIVAGAAYYTVPKKTTADAEYHTVQAGETMQQISQQYGIKLNYLRYKNRMARNEVPVPGRVLWLQKRRPVTTPVEVKSANEKQGIAKNAAPSYNRPEGTNIKETPTAAAKKDEAPKDNVFKRFINSFKKDKKAATPAEETPVVAQTKPAATPAKEADPVAAEKTPEQAVTSEKTEVVETATAQPKGALYPSSKDKLVIKPKTENPTAVKTEEKPQPKQETKATVKTEPKQEEKPVAKTTEKPMAAKQEEVKQEESEEEVESILYQEKEKTESTKPAKTTTKAVETSTSKKEPVKTAKSEKAEEEQMGTFVTYSRDVLEEAKEDATAKTPVAKSAKHVVSKGESLYAISKKYNVTVAQLTAWNSLSNTALQPSQELIVAEPLGAAEVVAKESEVKEPAKPATETHTVVPGETLYQISKRYNVTVDELRSWNNLVDNNLKLGQELRVVAPEEKATAPAPKTTEKTAPATTESTYHTVDAGESMYQISRKYGVTIKDVMEWNNKSDFNVKPGEKLLIKKN
ncbi:LysM peptidoglycan-binding domain-containing protein [Pontibacter cellulosilyticus]|uniref:LysM peptidoglycan-binding domain-containing protein n=1 Tax=Pontibacter cellulosilyticus TaxID=1720253 RepID=A0A923N7Z5_9BACT|nr:LysM peptidoglycan-binding domain-containing protein [Pontibacter cellulosilyticus]MBC5993091.1 LysM peptidoglycan-binding domain-containing protein [Pontibacter cellulosilyticus]